MEKFFVICFSAAHQGFRECFENVFVFKNYFACFWGLQIN